MLIARERLPVSTLKQREHGMINALIVLSIDGHAMDEVEIVMVLVIDDDEGLSLHTHRTGNAVRR